MASQLAGIAAQAAAAYMGSGGYAAAGKALGGGMGGGTTGGSGGGNGQNGGLGGGAGSGGLFGGAFDLSTRSSTDATTLGGGGFDGSGWTVNIGSGSQQGVSSSPNVAQGYSIPSKVGYTVGEYGMPQTVTAPQYLGGVGGAASTAQIPPMVLIGAGLLVVVLIMKGRK